MTSVHVTGHRLLVGSLEVVINCRVVVVVVLDYRHWSHLRMMLLNVYLGIIVPFSLPELFTLGCKVFSIARLMSLARVGAASNLPVISERTDRIRLIRGLLAVAFNGVGVIRLGIWREAGVDWLVQIIEGEQG
uniref:Uncharacterized protein n=1 Tax=Strombidium inclinatum TaxID=197538 RepID=A0A7S3IVP2_9SPIT